MMLDVLSGSIYSIQVLKSPFPVCVAMLPCVQQARGVCHVCWSGLVCTISDTSDYVGSQLILFLNYIQSFGQFRERRRNFKT